MPMARAVIGLELVMTGAPNPPERFLNLQRSADNDSGSSGGGRGVNSGGIGGNSGLTPGTFVRSQPEIVSSF